MRVKCLAQEHNTMSPARARTRTPRSGVERTNHEATAPPTNANAHILERKSPNHTTRTALHFRKSLLSDLTQGNSFRMDTHVRSPPTPEARFNQEFFHHLVRSDKRSACKVRLQRVDTLYSCALIYHTLRDYRFNSKDREGPRRLKEGIGRPQGRGRRRLLQNITVKRHSYDDGNWN